MRHPLYLMCQKDCHQMCMQSIRAAIWRALTGQRYDLKCYHLKPNIVNHYKNLTRNDYCYFLAHQVSLQPPQTLAPLPPQEPLPPSPQPAQEVKQPELAIEEPLQEPLQPLQPSQELPQLPKLPTEQSPPESLQQQEPLPQPQEPSPQPQELPQELPSQPKLPEQPPAPAMLPTGPALGIPAPGYGQYEAPYGMYPMHYKYNQHARPNYPAGKY